MNYCQTCIFAEKKNEGFAYCKNFEKCVSNSEKCTKHILNKADMKK